MLRMPRPKLRRLARLWRRPCSMSGMLEPKRRKISRPKSKEFEGLTLRSSRSRAERRNSLAGMVPRSIMSTSRSLLPLA